MDYLNTTHKLQCSSLSPSDKLEIHFIHQENSKLLEWLEPVSPVVPARQQIGWTYVDMPESSTCAGRENHWCQSLALDLVHSSGTSCCDLVLSFIFTHTACKWS